MELSLDDLRFLTSDEGVRLLDDLATKDLSETRTLPMLTQLRKTYTAEQSAAAMTMAQLRRKATEKFGEAAARLLFTTAALEQASHPLVRRYRAGQVIGASVLDACCGIGADSMAFASTGTWALGLDINPVRITIARHNAAALNLQTATFEIWDVLEGVPAGYDVIFFDPARRDETGKRLYHVESYQPPLSLIQSWKADRIMVKLSPGVKLDQLADYAGHVEFISVQGALKEAVLHYGDDTLLPGATLLAGNAVYHWREVTLPEVPIGKPSHWLVEPDPAIIRAGLVQAVAAQWNGCLLDETIAYFTTEKKPVSPWVRTWEIKDWMPFQLKRLRAYLREQQVGKVTVKKRGFPMQPEELIARLKLKKGHSQSLTLVLTRCQGQPVVLICSD